jgi:UDP-glucose 4-epimerase
MAELQIAEYCRAHDLRAVCLRYFNAAGADPDGEIGEAHEPETHLIPNIIKAALDPGAPPVNIFGNDYDTPDGTCVRDYVHVIDLCDAHLLALSHMDQFAGLRIFNLGTENGSSVLEVLAACRSICAEGPSAVVRDRRHGDPQVLVASSVSAGTVLGWRSRASLADCVGSALDWHAQGFDEMHSSTCPQGG